MKGHRPLSGQWIIITRPAERAGDLVARLADEGADCLVFPTIETSALDLSVERERELRAAVDDDYLIFTSQEGVAIFAKRARELRLLPLRPQALLVAIGPATAASVDRELGRAADIVARESRAEGVIEALTGRELFGRGASLLRAAQGRALIPEALAAAGMRVRDLALYRTSLLAGDSPPALAGRQARVVFSSASQARGFSSRFVGLPGGLRAWEAGGVVRYLAIGPPTAEAARALGFAPLSIARRHDAEGIVEALKFEVAGGR